MAAPVKGIKKFADIFSINADDIVVEKDFNVREYTEQELLDLAYSIKEKNILEPLRVRKGLIGDEKGKTILIDGHHRLKAAHIAVEKLGASADILKAIPIYFQEASETDKIADLIVLNSGKPLTAYEQAKVVEKLLVFKKSNAEIASILGKPVKEVQKLRQLIQAPESVQQAIKANIISTTGAIELLKHKPEVQTKIMAKIATKMQEAQTKAEQLAKMEKPAAKPEAKPEAKAEGKKPEAKAKKAEKPAKATPKKQKAAITVGDIKKEAGKRTEIPVTEIREKRVQVNRMWKNTSEPLDKKLWQAVEYGIDIALGTSEVQMNHFDNVD